MNECDLLTSRELDVVALIGNGYTSQRIARVMDISENTVHRHIDHSYRKLGIRSRPQLAVWAFQQGLG